METLWDFVGKFCRHLGLGIVLLALFGGFVNGMVMMVQLNFWVGFYWMLQTWVVGTWMGLVLIMIGNLHDHAKGS